MDASLLPADMAILIEDLIEDELPEFFEMKWINPCAAPRVDLSDSDRGTEHADEMDIGSCPPLVVAHGCLLDGRHRLWKMQKTGVKKAACIDISELLPAGSPAFKRNVIVDLGI